MSEKAKNLTVNIYGQEYILKTDGDQVYINKIAEYVNSKMKEIDRRDGWLFAGAALNIDSVFDMFNYALYTQIVYPIRKNLLMLQVRHPNTNNLSNFRVRNLV